MTTCQYIPWPRHTRISLSQAQSKLNMSKAKANVVVKKGGLNPNWAALQAELKAEAAKNPKPAFRKVWRKRVAPTPAPAKEAGEEKVEGSASQRGSAVGLDCEYVGVGKDGTEDMLARVSIVDASGEVLLDEFVKPTERVTDFRTQFSGIRPSLITQDSAKSFEETQGAVDALIAGRIVVGHALYNDFKVLKMSHPRSLLRDTARYKPFQDTLGGIKNPSLKKVARAALGLEVQKGEHDSVSDARIAMQLYQVHRKQWESERRKMKSKFRSKKTKKQ